MTTTVYGAPELVASAGGAEGDFGVVVLGQLGTQLYAFGSQGESAGALAGVGRVAGGAYEHLGTASADEGVVDYNRLTAHGAVEYQGSLYVGDRRTGGLFRLALDETGGFRDVVRVADTPSAEDVFPGPVLQGLLYLGSYGKDTGAEFAPDSPALVMTWDGSRLRTVLSLSDLGHGGEVLSMTEVRGVLYVTAASKDRSRGQLWRIEPGLRPRLLQDGPDAYQLTAVGGELRGVRQSYDSASSPLPYVVRWDGKAFQRLTPDFGEVGNVAGVYAMGSDLLVFHYYAGVFLYRAGVVLKIADAPPRVTSAKVFEGALWLSGNQPASLWRMPLTTLLPKTAGAKERGRP